MGAILYVLQELLQGMQRLFQQIRAKARTLGKSEEISMDSPKQTKKREFGKRKQSKLSKREFARLFQQFGLYRVSEEQIDPKSVCKWYFSSQTSDVKDIPLVQSHCSPSPLSSILIHPPQALVSHAKYPESRRYSLLEIKRNIHFKVSKALQEYLKIVRKGVIESNVSLIT